MQQWGTPGDHGAEVVTDDDRPLGAGAEVRVEQTHDVGRQLRHGVSPYIGGFRRAAVTTLVGRQHVITGAGQHGDLMPPRVRQFGKAVCQDHDGRTTFTRLDHA
jgi:hypothetical protein